VIDTRADPPVYVVQGATVVDRASGDGAGGVLSTATKLWVSIQVTADQGLAMAAVIDADKFVVIRSTGAAPAVAAGPPTTLSPSTSLAVGEGGDDAGRRGARRVKPIVGRVRRGPCA
jgi:hypothetical protein